MNDPIGKAIFDFYLNGTNENIVVNSNYTEDESIPPSYFFRSFEDMPIIEQKALELCQSNILDIGAGAGCHSVILQEKGFDITALESSSLACDILLKRGINKIINENIFKYNELKYNTLLLLMNGTGISGNIRGLKKLFLHLKTLLKPNGQILIDSSDIKYLFEEEDGSILINLNQKNYYGEMTYQVSYKNYIGKPFKWLFIDFDKMNKIASSCGLKCEKILEGDHYDYLSRITLK